MESKEQQKVRSILHPTVLGSRFFEFQCQGQLTDTFLTCPDGGKFAAHRLILAANSQFFHDLFLKKSSSKSGNASSRPKGNAVNLDFLRGQILEYIIQFIYLGEVFLPLAALEEFKEASEHLQLRGFSADGDQGSLSTMQNYDSNDIGLCAKCHHYPAVPGGIPVKQDPDAENGNDYLFDYFDENEKPVKPPKVLGKYAINHMVEKADATTGQKYYICELCDYSSTNKGNCKRHMILKHVKPKEFPCQYCGDAFKNQYSLQAHQKKKVCSKNIMLEEFE